MVSGDPEDVLGVLDKDFSLELPYSMMAYTYLGFSPNETKRQADTDIRLRETRLKFILTSQPKSFKITLKSFLTKINVDINANLLWALEILVDN